MRDRRSRPRAAPPAPFRYFPNPENTPEEKRRRRGNAIAFIKRTEEYSQALIYCSRDGRGAPEPPDPNDLSVSKRAWERGVQQWRREIRQVLAAHAAAAAAAAAAAQDGHAPQQFHGQEPQEELRGQEQQEEEEEEEEEEDEEEEEEEVKRIFWI